MSVGTDGFAEAGAKAQDEAVMEGGTSEVAALEGLEFHWAWGGTVSDVPLQANGLFHNVRPPRENAGIRDMCHRGWEENHFWD